MGTVDTLASGATLLRGFALASAAELLAAIETVTAAAPLRHLQTRGGFRMSVSMTNCGTFGWISDRRGYRYERCDPMSGLPWPSMPAIFTTLATAAAHATGYEAFEPDACLVNRYVAGARMALHQDKDEHDFSQPIVSVSLGMPATFLFGGAARANKPQRRRVCHGDVVVWGGASRLAFHGVMPLTVDLDLERGRDAADTAGAQRLGAQRYNLTLRRAR